MTTSVSMPLPAQEDEILLVHDRLCMTNPNNTLIGKGSFCQVFKEEWTNGQVVAVKRPNLLTLNSRLALAKEYNVLSRCNHPNIIKLLDSQNQEQRFSVSEIRMPMIPVDLPLWLRDKTNRQVSCMTKIMSQLFDALDHLHTQCGFVHGDIKPPNVLISLPECVPILIDFNLAFPCTRKETMDYALTLCDDDVTGSPLYMAPERLKYPRLRHPASDVWAMGLLGYVMFAGEEPWPAYKNRDLFFTHLALGCLIPQLERPAACPTSVWMVLNRCWQQNYLSRPTASTLSSEFAELSEQFLN